MRLAHESALVHRWRQTAGNQSVQPKTFTKHAGLQAWAVHLPACALMHMFIPLPSGVRDGTIASGIRDARRGPCSDRQLRSFTRAALQCMCCVRFVSDACEVYEWICLRARIGHAHALSLELGKGPLGAGVELPFYDIARVL